MAPHTTQRPLRCISLAAATALAVRQLAFVVSPSQRLPAASISQVGAESLRLPAAAGATSGSTSSSSSSAGAAMGAWAVALALTSLRGRTALRSGAQEEVVKAGEMKQEPFDVFKPDTYGNITMDDVKKYGAAGTAAYVITELLFWAVAVPTECAVFYQTAGRWPDFSNDMDKAAVLGFVFAASNIARLCLPLRFGAALAMAPWVDENIFGGKKTSVEA